jgi:peptidoglycan/xylan/chitin deacetylase (PgdA/CDA1 family)
MPDLPILLYHNLEQQRVQYQPKPAIERPYILPLDLFKQHMACLAQNGYQTILPQQIQQPEQWPAQPVMISFDNGHEAQHRLALPILQQYGFKAVFFITTDYIERSDYMTADNLHTLVEQGMAIGSHGVSHQSLDDVPRIEIEHELSESQNLLQKLVGQTIDSFAAPCGQQHPDMPSICLSVGYRTVFGARFGYYNPQKSRFDIPRIAIKRDCNLKQFKHLLQQQPHTLQRLYLQDNVLFAAKFLLGKAAYQKTREALLGWWY